MKRWTALTTAQSVTRNAPALTEATNEFIYSQTGSQPLARPSAYDQVSRQPWEQIPLTIRTVVAVEGVNYPFRSRIWVDNAQRAHAKRWADRKRAAQPQVLPIPLVLHAPVDDTPRFVGKVDTTPTAWRAWQRDRRVLIAATPATWQWGARLSAYLPATVYPDTSCRIYSEIQRHLLESPVNTGLSWSLWTTDEVASYLTQRIARFLVESGLIRERRDVAVAAREVSLPSDTLEVLRTVWNTGTTRSVLVRIDKWSLDNGLVNWQTAVDEPIYYTEDTSSALGAEVTPTPTTAGVLELVIISAPAEDPRHCYPINLPAIFTPYIKYGVLSDMLSKQGEANDPQRAGYCEGRFAEGVELAKLFFAGKV